MPPALKALVIESARYRPIIKNVLVRDPRLRNLRMEVLLAGDGLEGLLLFRNKSPDLVILELLLPKMSGFELVRAIRNETSAGKKVPIIVTSALARDMTSLRVLEKHFEVHVLLKPFTPYDLAKTVQKVLQLAKKGKGPRAGSRLTGPTRPSPTTGAAAAAETVEITPDPGSPTPPGREPALVDLDIGSVDITPSPEAQSAEQNREAIKRFMRGSLSETPLPMLLLEAHDQRLSGTLTLRVDKIRKVIYLLSGHPIYVQSNLRRETLGQMLVGKGRLSADENSRALHIARNQRRPYGKTLVDMGLMSDDELSDELLSNTRNKLETSLSWRQGSWLFIQDHEVGNKVPHCVVDPVKLVFEGLKRRAPVEEALVRLTGQEDCGFRLQPQFDSYREQFISTFGGRLAEVAEPGMSMGQVLVAMGSYPQEAVFQMFVLLECGLARLEQPTREAQAAEEPAFPLAELEEGKEPILSTPEEADLDDVETIDTPAPCRPPSAQETVQIADRPETRPDPGSEPTLEPVPVPEHAPDAADRSTQELIQTADTPGVEPRGAPPQHLVETADAPSPARLSPEARKARRLIRYTFKSLKRRNHYDLLGVEPWSDEEAIAEAHDMRRIRFSPRNFAGLNLGEELIQQLDTILDALELAHDVLVNPEARKAYNRSLGFSDEDGFDDHED